VAAVTVKEGHRAREMTQRARGTEVGYTVDTLPRLIMNSRVDWGPGDELNPQSSVRVTSRVTVRRDRDKI
jgi:hypothetical protein